MMIATNSLFKSVIGPGNGFRAIMTPRQFIVLTSVEYAREADERRTFMSWSDGTMKEFRRMISQYVFKDRVKGSR
jgi:hypothetical protein